MTETEDPEEIGAEAGVPRVAEEMQAESGVEAAWVKAGEGSLGEGSLTGV